MKLVIELVLASTYALPDAVHNFYTFRITRKVKSVWRRLLGLPPKMCTVYASGSWYPDFIDVLPSEYLPSPIWDHIDAASEVFAAVHSTGKISNDAMRKAAKLWGSRMNDVLKFRKVSEYHIPSWDGINLTDHMAEATPNRGWVRTQGGN